RTLVRTGRDIEEKAAWAEQELFAILGGRAAFAEVDTRLLRFDREDAPTNEQATAHLRITVKDPDPRRVGRRVSNAIMELALAGYPGVHNTPPPTPGSSYGRGPPGAGPGRGRRPRGGAARRQRQGDRAAAGRADPGRAAAVRTGAGRA